MGITNFDKVEAPEGFTCGENQPAAISDVATGAGATAGENATAINAILAALRTHGVIAEA